MGSLTWALIESVFGQSFLSILFSCFLGKKLKEKISDLAAQKNENLYFLAHCYLFANIAHVGL